jgi:GNAT superfamily N-acetyltransferase
MLGNEAVGWCQLTRRCDLPHLDQVRKLTTVDDQPVWSISCFYIRKGYRKRAITAVLIEAAIRAAKRNSAPALEAYPLDARLTPSSSWTGYASTFLRAGFKVAFRNFPPQPVVRLQRRKRSS